MADSGMLSHLEAGRFSELMSQIRSLILATDIARQGEFIGQFQVSWTVDIPQNWTPLPPALDTAAPPLAAPVAERELLPLCCYL